MATGERPNNDFCWINVLSPDPAAARDFFAKLLRWEYVEIPGIGHRIQVGGHDLGGLWDLNSPNTPPGTPPGIGVMIRVADADATSARATALGGTGKPAFDVMDQGRMAELVDPNGAMIDVWQANKSLGITADSTRHGVPSWIESLTSDVPRAVAFYRELFGWQDSAMPMPDFEYTVFTRGDAPVAGMMAITPEMGSFPPHWGVYCTVDDVDAAAAHTTELGGTITMPLMDIPEIGRMVGIASPQGVMLYLITYLPRS